MGLVILVVTLGKVLYVAAAAAASLELVEYQVLLLFMPFTRWASYFEILKIQL